MVRQRGLEPPWDCSRQPLKLVRLPISPLPQRSTNGAEHTDRAPRARAGSPGWTGAAGSAGAGAGAGRRGRPARPPAAAPAAPRSSELGDRRLLGSSKSRSLDDERPEIGEREARDHEHDRRAAVVSLERKLPAPRLPKTVELPPPPKTAPISAPLPRCSSTTRDQEDAHEHVQDGQERGHLGTPWLWNAHDPREILRDRGWLRRPARRRCRASPSAAPRSRA